MIVCILTLFTFAKKDMNKIETVILDFDGTIADTKNSIIQTIQATLEILGLSKANDNEIKNLIGLPLEETFIKEE